MPFPDAKHASPTKRGPNCSYHGPARSPGDIRLIVIHDTEGSSFPRQPSADAIAAYGASKSAQASWHVTVDQEKVVRCLDDDVVAWGAPGANYDGLHVEICGYARWSKLQWFRHQATLKRAAWQVARWCQRYDVPPRWLSDKQLRLGARGLTTHAQVGRVFDRTDHTDPGPAFPRGYFQLLVRRRIRWLKQTAF